MESSLQHRVYLVTGGAGAIGTATAQALVEAGASVVLLDVDANAAALRAGEIDARLCCGRACDVTRRDDARAAV
jgi:NAD(P)-dependent dehydrogenase (short-subunit alcohol dehydrogenase family)